MHEATEIRSKHIQQQRTGGVPPCDQLWICRFVEELNNITLLENIVFGLFCIQLGSTGKFLETVVGKKNFLSAAAKVLKVSFSFVGFPSFGEFRCLASKKDVWSNRDLIIRGRWLTSSSVSISCLLGRGKTDGKQLQSITQH